MTALSKVDPATMKKTRSHDEPYEIWQFRDWEWRVLKKYKKDEDEFSIAFCSVKSDLIGGSYELGDVYVREYESVARLVAVNP